MSQILRFENGRWVLGQLFGVNTSLNRFLRSETQQGFSKEEIIKDVLSGTLYIEPTLYREATEEDYMSFVTSETFFHTSVDNEAIERWIYRKNYDLRLAENRLIKDGFDALEQRLDAQTEIIRGLGSKLMKLMDSLNKPSGVTISELHKQTFFNYNIRTLRNQVSSNRYFNEERNLYESYLELDGYYIKLKRFPGQKEWFTESVDLHPDLRSRIGAMGL